MPTKAELEHENRRLRRALQQAQIDLHLPPLDDMSYLTPHVKPTADTAIKRGLSEWESVVKDPSDRINTYIQSMQGIGWQWEGDYKRDGDFSWCGAFLAYCYTSVRFNIRHKIFPSCYRLYQNWGKTSRRINVDDMAPGDIVIVYTAKRSRQGDHITLCTEAPCNGTFTTVEGNAYGTLGDGEYGQGVITRERDISSVAHVYRLLSEDFDE